jgi:sporulation protein YlmC with PRC-barrel domain
MEKITQLLSLKVEGEKGEYLGRVVDVRSDGDPDHGLVNKDRPITEILYGKNGFLEVIGLRRAEVKLLPWKAVKKFGRGRIVVDLSKLK